jgi:hypothetical protein
MFIKRSLSIAAIMINKEYYPIYKGWVCYNFETPGLMFHD